RRVRGWIVAISMGTWLLGAGGAAAAGTAGVDAAASADADGCVKETNPDLQIAYCTRLIQSGELTGVDAAPAFYNRGVGYGRKGEYDRAIQDYDQAIRLKPDLAEAFNNRGSAYGNKGQYARAIQDFDEAIRLKPDYAGAFSNRGSSYLNKGQYD